MLVRALALATLLLLVLAPSARSEDPAGHAGHAGNAAVTHGEMVVRDVTRVGERGGVPVYRREFLSPTYTIDRIYKSMRGPTTAHNFALDPTRPRELLWIVGYRVTMVEPDGETRLSQEFMCHSNLAANTRQHVKTFRSQLFPTGGRLFTLSQGQLAIDLPEGFGVPMMSDQPIQLATQVLNHNVVGGSFGVRQNIVVDFVRDADLKQELVPLAPRTVFGMKLIEGADGFFGMDAKQVATMESGQGCLIGEDAGSETSHLFDDQAGRKFSGFWLLEPGREVNHTPVTQLLDLPYDTTLHYVAVHVHPFAESIELRDVTTDESVFKSHVKQASEGVGLSTVESYSSSVGIPLYADHQYELVSVYDNTSGVQQDAMATMVLYLRALDIDLARLRVSPTQSPTTSQ